MKIHPDSRKPLLVFKKEVITRLNDSQLKKIIGGLDTQNPTLVSCIRHTCASKPGQTGSCDDASCACTEPVITR